MMICEHQNDQLVLYPEKREAAAMMMATLIISDLADIKIIIFAIT